MATKQQSLLTDTRYPAFVERYAFDALRFAVEVIGLEPTWQQVELFNGVSVPGARVSVSSGHGCFAAGTMMMRANGRAVAVEDIRVGDRLMGPDGASTRNVLQLKRGREAMYRFTYSDGTQHVFNESHLLCLVPGAKYKDRTPFKVTVREWLMWNKTRKERHYVYRSHVESFETEAKPLPVPPYVLGLWLGDGTTGKPEITTPDKEVQAAWARYLCERRAGMHIELNSTSAAGEPCWRMSAVRELGTAQQNPVTAQLRAAGAYDRKHIPDAYKYASLQDRRELVAGLIDTDGHYDKSSGGYDWIQKDEQLARDFWWLVRSIGCHATIRSCRKGCQTGAVGTYWRVTVGRCVDTIPVRIARKRRPAELPKQRDKLQFSIRSVEPLGEGDYYGFTLDADGRFLDHSFNVLSNTGKTNGFGALGLWHLLCYVRSNTFLTAPKAETVQKGVFKEFAGHYSAIQRGPHAWICDYFTIEAEKVYVKGFKLEWWIVAKTAPRGSPENLAGAHNAWLLWLADESSGIPDANFGVIGGSLTDERNRMAMASQPTRPSGFFYDSHHRLSKDNGGPWMPLVFNSEESPLVSDSFIRDKLIEYGGEESPEYQIKVQGRFPENGEGFLLGRKAVEARVGAPRVIAEDEDWGHLLVIDVGAGVHRDKTVMSHFKVIGKGDRLDPDPRRVDLVDVPIYSNSMDWAEVARKATDYALGLSNVSVLVDASGMGIQFARQMEQYGCPNVKAVKWGEYNFKARLKERFYNQRAQCTVHAAEAVKDGRISLADKERKDMLDQASRLPFFIDEKGRWHIWKKEDMQKEGIPSPDLWDTVCMAFLEDAHYIVHEGSSQGISESKAKLVDDMAAELEAELADLGV